MNKKIKYIVISVLLLLVTGCSGNYNVKINEDMSVNEELYFIEQKQKNKVIIAHKIAITNNFKRFFFIDIVFRAYCRGNSETVFLHTYNLALPLRQHQSDKVLLHVPIRLR